MILEYSFRSQCRSHKPCICTIQIGGRGSGITWCDFELTYLRPSKAGISQMSCKEKEEIKKVNLCGKSQKQQNEITWKRHPGVSGRLLTTRSQMVITVFEMKQLEVQRTRI